MLQSTLVGWRAHVILKALCSDFVGSSQHFGSEWFGNFGRNSFYTNSAGETFFTEFFCSSVIILVSKHTYCQRKHWKITEYRRQHGNSINWTIQRKLSSQQEKQQKDIWIHAVYEEWKVGKISYMNTKHTKYHQHSINRENSFTLKGNKDEKKYNKNILNFPTLRHLPQKFVIKSEQHVCFFFYVLYSLPPTSTSFKVFSIIHSGVIALSFFYSLFFVGKTLENPATKNLPIQNKKHLIEGKWNISNGKKA